MSHMEEEGLLTRWSRRKLQSPEETAEEDAQLEVLDDQAVVDEGTGAEEEKEPPVLTDADMPPIESLNEDSDFSVFMSSGVSDKLRNLALRKMFHVPAFNIRDGLDEYDEDFTTFEALGDIVTCDMKHQLEMQEKKKAEKEAEEAALAEAQAEDVELDPEAAEESLDDEALDSLGRDESPEINDHTDAIDENKIDEEASELELEKL